MQPITNIKETDVKETKEIKEFAAATYQYNTKGMPDITKELNKLLRLYLCAVYPEQKKAMQKYNKFSIQTKRIAPAIEELAPIFEERFKGRYPLLDITQELKIFNMTNNPERIITGANYYQPQCAATYFIKKALSKEGDKEDITNKLIMLLGEDMPDSSAACLSPRPMMLKDTYPPTSILIDHIIFNRFGGKKAEKSDPLDPKLDKSCKEYERFMQLLEMMPAEEIMRLKEEFLDNMLEYFNEYLYLKNKAMMETNGIGMDPAKKALKAYASHNHIINTLYTAAYLNKNAQDILDPDIMRTKHLFDKINPEETAFIIFYILETEDPLGQMLALTISLYEGIASRLPYFTTASMLLPLFKGTRMLKDNPYMIIKCPNPEADIEELKFRICKKGQNSFPCSDELELYMDINQFIETLTGMADLLKENEYTQSFQKAIEKSGIPEKKARLIAMMADSFGMYGHTYTFSGLNGIEMYKKIKEPETSKEAARQTPKQEQQASSALKAEKEILKLEEKTKLLEEKNKRLEEKIKELKTYIRKDIDKKAAEMANDKLIKIIEEEAQIEEESPEIEFPQILDKKVVVFGGHDTWTNQMRQYLPGVTYVDRKKNPDEQLIRNADSVWVQTNAICHPYYFKIMAVMKNMGKELKFCNSASALTCAKKIYLREKE